MSQLRASAYTNNDQGSQKKWDNFPLVCRQDEACPSVTMSLGICTGISHELKLSCAHYMTSSWSKHFADLIPQSQISLFNFGRVSYVTEISFYTTSRSVKPNINRYSIDPIRVDLDRGRGVACRQYSPRLKLRQATAFSTLNCNRR
jgi:hypothetical protein